MGTTIKLIRKAAVFIAGFIVLFAGVIMLVTPGPGLLGIIAGLLILSIEFTWAEEYLRKARKKLKEANDKIRKKDKQKLPQDVDRPGNHKSKGKSRD